MCDAGPRKPIGLGEQRSGVFFFKDTQLDEVLVNQVVTTDV